VDDRDDEMEQLAAAAVDEKLADALQSAQLKQQAAEIQRRTAVVKLKKLERAEPPDGDAIELAKLAVEQAANRVAQEAQRVSAINAQVHKAAEQMALALDIPEKVEEERPAVWNWWKATDEQKAEWIATIENWLTTYLFPFFPHMANARHIPECWKEHGDWLELLGTLYQDWEYVHTIENPEYKGWWLIKWRDALTEDALRESSASHCGFDKRYDREFPRWVHSRPAAGERSIFDEPVPEMHAGPESVRSAVDVDDGWSPEAWNRKGPTMTL
jgi:hypothetical protein